MTGQVPAYTVTRTQPRRTKHCLVIPVINEGARIARLLERIHQLGIASQLDVVIVDGGSRDGSLGAALLDACGIRLISM